MNPITQIRGNQRGIHQRSSGAVQDAFLLMCILFWCLLTAGWPGRGFRGADEIYTPGGLDNYLKFQIVAWLSLFCALIVILAAHTKFRKAVYDFISSQNIKLFVIYIGWATICITWSVSLKLSAFYVIKALDIVIVAALINMRISNPRQAIRLICYYGGLTSLAAIMSCILWPDQFHGRLGPPLFLGLSIIVPISLVFSLNRAISEYEPKVWLWGGVSLFFFIVVLLTRRRTLIVFTTIVLVIMAARHYRRGQIISAFVIALLCLLIIAYPSELWQLFNRGDLEDSMEIDLIKGLNGRLELWTYTLEELFNQGYLWGKGYVAGSRDWFAKDFIGMGTRFAGQHPHNVWLTAWVETGLPGFAIAIVLYYSLVRSAYLSIQKKWAQSESVRYAAGCGVILLVLSSLLSNGLAGKPAGWMLPVLLCMRWIDQDRKPGQANSLVSHYNGLTGRRGV